MLSLPILEAEEILEAMAKRIKDNLLFQRWIPYQDQVSFDEFKNSIDQRSSRRYDTRKPEEILKDVRKILNKAQGG